MVCEVCNNIGVVRKDSRIFPYDSDKLTKTEISLCPENCESAKRIEKYQKDLGSLVELLAENEKLKNFIKLHHPKHCERR